jgi:hypothetical protein
MIQKRKNKHRSTRTILRLPDLDHSKTSVVQSPGAGRFKANVWVSYRRLHYLLLLRAAPCLREDRGSKVSLRIGSSAFGASQRRPQTRYRTMVSSTPILPRVSAASRELAANAWALCKRGGTRRAVAGKMCGVERSFVARWFLRDPSLRSGLTAGSDRVSGIPPIAELRDGWGYPVRCG